MQRKSSTNMPPPFAVDDPTHDINAHSVLTGQRGLGDPANPPPCPDILDAYIREFGPGVSFTHHSPALGEHVRMVIRRSAQEKMIRPHATAIGDIANGIVNIAVVAHIHAFGDSAVVDLPRYPVSVIATTTLPAEANPAITITQSAPGPEPTSLGFLHLGPESLLNRHPIQCLADLLTWHAAIAGIGQGRDLDFIGLATDIARPGNLLRNYRVQSQMLGSHAHGLAAGMRHLHSVRDGAEVEFPREVVRPHQPSTATGAADQTVTLGNTGSRPNPAPTGLLNLGPKPLSDGGPIKGPPCVLAFATAKPGPCDFSSWRIVRLTADFADPVGNPVRSGRMGVHVEPPTQVRCATPGGVCTVARALLCS